MSNDDFIELIQEPLLLDGVSIHLYDKILVPRECRLVLRLLSVNSPWKQGIRLGDMLKRKTDLRLDVNGHSVPGLVLWTDTCPPEVEITVLAPQERLFVYNIWDNGNGKQGSQVTNAGMLIQRAESQHLAVYRCTDAHSAGFEETLVFSIEIR